MTTALLESPTRMFGESAGDPPPAGGRATLEERLRETWRALNAHGAAECPVCRSRMMFRDGSGECGSCGSRLT
jgi:hypothetical protein